MALATIYRYGKKTAPALEAAEKALAIDPSNAMALYERGAARLRQSPPQYEAAQRDLLAARERNPASIEVRLTLAEVYSASGQRVPAVRELEPVLNRDPLDRTARTMLINLCLTDKPPQLDRAQQLATEAQAIPQLKSEPLWYRLEGRVLLLRGQQANGVTCFRKALELAPNDIDSEKDLLEGLRAAGDDRGVVSEADRVLTGDPKAEWAYFSRARARRKLGNAAGASQDFAAALAHLGTPPDFNQASPILGTIAAEVNTDEALHQLAAMAQGAARWRLLEAQLLWQKHDGAAAIVALEAVLKELGDLTPEQQDTALRLAAVVYGTGAERPLFEQASSVYRQLLERNPLDQWALNNLACLLVEGVSPPRPTEAIVYSQRAYDAMQQGGPYNASIADTHGSILEMNGKADDAVRILQRVVSEAPSPETVCDLADAYFAQGSLPAAVKQYQQAQALSQAAEQKGQPVPPQLKSRIQAGIAKASK